MKRAMIVSVFVICLMASAGFGDVLNVATPIGADKLAIQGFYSSTSIAIADSGLTEFGPKLIYGITPDLDIIGKFGIGSIAGNGATTIGMGMKYTFLSVSANNSFDLAGLINYESAAAKGVSMGHSSIGVIISKLINPGLTIYGVSNLIMSSVKVTDVPYSTGSGIQIGGGLKYEIDNRYSCMTELTIYGVDGQSYSTFSLGLQYGLI